MATIKGVLWYVTFLIFVDWCVLFSVYNYMKKGFSLIQRWKWFLKLNLGETENSYVILYKTHSRQTIVSSQTHTQHSSGLSAGIEGENESLNLDRELFPTRGGRNLIKPLAPLFVYSPHFSVWRASLWAAYFLLNHIPAGMFSINFLRSYTLLLLYNYELRDQISKLKEVIEVFIPPSTRSVCLGQFISIPYWFNSVMFPLYWLPC